MKSRRAAALALVSWYLIAPGDKFVPDSACDAGMATEWFRLGTFDTEAQCDQAQETVAAKVAKAFEKQRLVHHKLTFQIGDAAECEDSASNPHLADLPIWKSK